MRSVIAEMMALGLAGVALAFIMTGGIFGVSLLFRAVMAGHLTACIAGAG